MSQRTLVLFAKLIQKRSFIYVINVRSQILKKKKIEDFWFALSNEHEKLLQRDVFIGKLWKSDLLNYLSIVAKLHIWSSRHFAKSLNFDVFNLEKIFIFLFIYLYLSPLLHSSTPPFLHSSTPPLLHSSTPPLLHSSTPPLLHSSTP